MSIDLDLEFAGAAVSWEGPAEVELFDVYLGVGGTQAYTGSLQAFYVVPRETTLSNALGYFGALDTITPTELKGIAYYAFQAAVFCCAVAPISAVHVPACYEKLADIFLEDHDNRRRYFRERDLVGVLSDRVMLKSAIEFLVGKGILEQTGIGEFAVTRRPVRKLKFL